MTRNSELLDKIDAAIARKHLLQHPFYQDWQAGKLSREELQLYAAQYYRHVEAFPKHLRVLAARTEGPVRNVVMENLAQEEDPAGPHPKLWRDFAAALGISEEDITCCPALPAAQSVVATFREIAGDRTVAEAVAALYAYESQVPRVAAEKASGLRAMYGADAKTTRYFTLHTTADVHHAKVWKQSLEQQIEADPAAAQRALDAAEAAAKALWTALDGIERQRLARVQ